MRWFRFGWRLVTPGYPRFPLPNYHPHTLPHYRCLPLPSGERHAGIWMASFGWFMVRASNATRGLDSAYRRHSRHLVRDYILRFASNYPCWRPLVLPQVEPGGRTRRPATWLGSPPRHPHQRAMAAMPFWCHSLTVMQQPTPVLF